MQIDEIKVYTQPDNQMILRINTSGYIIDVEIHNGSYPRFYESYWETEDDDLIELLIKTIQLYEEYESNIERKSERKLNEN